MSDYSQITFFTPKDGLATGNPNKIIYGSDVDAELSAISTAIATKADIASPTFTGTVTIPALTFTGTLSTGTIDGGTY